MKVTTLLAAAAVGAGLAFVAPAADAMPLGNAPVDVSKTNTVEKVHAVIAASGAGTVHAAAAHHAANVATPIVTITAATNTGIPVVTTAQTTITVVAVGSESF